MSTCNKFQAIVNNYNGFTTILEIHSTDKYSKDSCVLIEINIVVNILY